MQKSCGGRSALENGLCTQVLSYCMMSKSNLSSSCVFNFYFSVCAVVHAVKLGTLAVTITTNDCSEAGRVKSKVLKKIQKSEAGSKLIKLEHRRKLFREK